MVLDSAKHYPVLLSEVISVITPQRGGTFIDCTFGQGGYSKKILSFKDTRVIALDRDIESKKKADLIKDKFPERFIFKNKKFSQLNDIKLKYENIRGVIFDLGYSYTQIKDSTKGLSFNSTGNLNMQMGINDFSAQDVVNKLDAQELEKIFKFFGEEKEAKKIAVNIIKKRENEKISTEGLVQLIERTKRLKNFKFLPKNLWCKNILWFNVIILEKKSKLTKILKYITKKKINCGSFWKPLHLQNPYKKFKKEKLDYTNKVWNKILVLPSSSNLKKIELNRVINIINSIN